MKWREFNDAYQAAQKALRGFEGGRNFPGLTKHDRVYALPVDWQREKYVAIVRASALQAFESSTIPLTIWHWHWRGGQEVKLEDLNERQLVAVAGIKTTVRLWLQGEIEALPPSTDDSWRIEDEP